jgi:hypothetical protein
VGHRSQACRLGLTGGGPTGLGVSAQAGAEVGEKAKAQPGMAVLLELELEGELDRTRAADLVEGVEAAIGAAGAQAAG